MIERSFCFLFSSTIFLFLLFPLVPLFLLLTIESFLKKGRKNAIRIFTRNPQQCVSRWTINIRKLKHLTFRYDTRNIYTGVYVSLRISSNRGFTFTCRERSESMMRVSLSMPAINEHENVCTYVTSIFFLPFLLFFVFIFFFFSF